MLVSPELKITVARQCELLSEMTPYLPTKRNLNRCEPWSAKHGVSRPR
ncbi:hypothetical protein [Piscirickettsia salmonis]|nr:hypothetical protein [Piscirickettsia salmonis]